MDVRSPPDTEPGERMPDSLERARAMLAKLPRVRTATFPAGEWHRRLDAKGQTVHTLALRDEEGEVSAEFTRDELALTNSMISRTAHLYGDLLAIHSDHLRDRYFEVLAMPEEAFESWRPKRKP